MALPRPHYLSFDDVGRALATLPTGRPVQVTNVRHKNKQEIRKTVELDRDELLKLIGSYMDEGHQPGGDIEVQLPALGTTLVGHHDGVYWLEPGVPGFPQAKGDGG